MPPKGSKIKPPEGEREPDFERTPEYEEFIKKLTEYHEKRGTKDIFDPLPKVSVHYLNLKDLYERVLEEGGYDLVSDTKARPLMWRKLAEEFVGRGPYVAAQAFQVKSAYYRNLAAFEISEHWKEDPPPREILEDLTAKGSGVRGRTMETFERPPAREAGKLGNGEDNDSEDNENTPKQGKMDVDELGNTTGRSTRGLRQAPPQRVLFQPDLGPPRQTRNATNPLTSPSPGAVAANGIAPASYLTNGTNATLASYEPRQQYPLSLKPVITPANNPDHYRLKRKQQKDASVSQIAKRFKGIMLPGTGFIGPNIYVRAQLALQSGLPEEEQYALHHLVKISHERGDKYRFDQFPGLAEALINKVLQVSNLFYDVDWAVTYGEHFDDDDRDVLDGLYGTSDVLSKLKARPELDTDDSIQDPNFTQALGRIAEAALVIRNMVMLDENAQYVSKLPLLRDYFAIVLRLKHSAVIELQHYALETAEQISLYYHIDSKDPFYQALLAQLQGHDRGKIITALRTVSRLGMRFAENKRLEDLPDFVLTNLCEWLMVEDEELRSACLDFLFQFTSVADNVEILVRSIDVKSLVRNLVRLLVSNAREDARRERRQNKPQDEPQPTQVPRLAKELIEQLLKHEEPERSSHWLRTCFEDDPNAEMTQIDLWKSYQGTFLPYAGTHPHLIAGDFIKNVSNTFSGASAQVAGQNKYVIRGIKPRVTPVDYRGRELLPCRWRADVPLPNPDLSTVFAHTDGSQCGQFFPNSASLLDHIISQHLQIPRKRPTPNEDGAAKVSPSTTSSPLRLFDFAAADIRQKLQCAWSTCNHTASQQNLPHQWMKGALMARHVQTHLPSANPSANSKNKQDSSNDNAKPVSTSSTWTWLVTLMDERNDAAGVPLGACLVMRNIARGISRMAPESTAQSDALAKTRANEGIEDRAAAGEEASKETSGKALLLQGIFAPVKEGLFYAVAHNYVLKDYLGTLLKTIAAGGA